MADFSGIYAKQYQKGYAYDGDVWHGLDYGGTMRAGYRWSNNNWVMCIKFILPTAAKSVTFSFCNQTNGVSAKATLRYKFTTAEDPTLLNATSSTPGEGSFTVEPGSYTRNTVTIEKKLFPGTHYFYIWTDNSNVQHNVLYTRWTDNSDGKGFYGSYEEQGGLVHIDTGTTERVAQVFIDTGTEVLQTFPYVDNGSEYVLYSG